MGDIQTQPLSSYYSTNLNPIVRSYERLATRIAYTLGYPQINIEAHQNQVFENISIAIEMFSKFAGYTEELLTFNSRLYEPGKGLRMDVLFTATEQFKTSHPTDPKDTKLDTDLYKIGKSVIGSGPVDYTVSYATSGNQTTSKDDNTEIGMMRSYDYLTDRYRKVIDVFCFEEGSSSGINTLFTLQMHTHLDTE